MKLNNIDCKGYETLLIDRDGTINVHIVNGYVTDWNDFEFIPGVLDALAHMAKSVKHIFIVTNQRCIGKGLLSENKLLEIHNRMICEIVKAGGRIDGVFFCSSLTDEDNRRKPGRGMFEEIINAYPDVNPKTTLMIGDGNVDEEFARNCDIQFQRVDSLKKENSHYYWIKSE